MPRPTEHRNLRGYSDFVLDTEPEHRRGRNPRRDAYIAEIERRTSVAPRNVASHISILESIRRDILKQSDGLTRTRRVAFGAKLRNKADQRLRKHQHQIAALDAAIEMAKAYDV